MLLQPDEHDLYGFTSEGQWDFDSQSRIEQLVSKHLERLAAADGGWTVLFRDPRDGRYWELTYPRSEMHGGGPARLTVISEDAARHKYDFRVSST